MRFFYIKGFLSAILLSPGAAFGAHWSYEGAGAPEYWGNLNSEYKQCQTGKNQSPTDIHTTLKTHLQPLQVDYRNAPQSIINNGYTIQINYPKNTENKIIIDNETFYLQQFHFHTPGENTVDGKHYPLEMRLVHKNTDNEIAVVAVMFKKGPLNETIKRLWDIMPTRSDQSHKIDSSLDIGPLLPEDMRYYRFTGSLTTPPCSEGVRWLVLKQPVTFSEKQQKKFMEVMHHANNRPVQTLHGRVIVE